MTSQNWRVIIADSNDDNVVMLEEALTYYESSMQVKRAKNGQECLSLINSFQPSLVIVDLALEEMDGWELLNAIRNNPVTQGLSGPQCSGRSSHRSPGSEDGLSFPC